MGSDGERRDKTPLLQRPIITLMLYWTCEKPRVSAVSRIQVLRSIKNLVDPRILALLLVMTRRPGISRHCYWRQVAGSTDVFPDGDGALPGSDCRG
jgi:hypothetical protein